MIHLSTEEKEYILNLPYHLAKADMADELSEILTEFKFMEYKVSFLRTNELLKDYNLALQPNIQISKQQQENLTLIQGAIRLSANVLSSDPTQISGQIIGRLLNYQHSEIIKILIKQAKEDRNKPWLRPLIPSLTPPNGLLLHSIDEHTGPIRCIIISPDGRRFISGAIDNEIKIWDIETGVKIGSLKGHTDSGGMRKSVLGLAITPDGKKIISASNDKTIKIWDIESGSKVFALKGHSKIISAVRITTNGKYIISASDDGTIKIWDLELRKEIRTINNINQEDSPLAITPDNKKIVSTSNNIIKIFDLDSGQELYTLTGHSQPVATLAVTPDGKKLVSGSFDMNIKIWSLRANTPSFSMTGHADKLLRS